MQGTFTEDSVTPWYLVEDNEGVHIGCFGNLGGGTVAVEQFVVDTARPMHDEFGAAIKNTATFDGLLHARKGDIIRLSMTGSTAPNADWLVTGAIHVVDVG